MLSNLSSNVVLAKARAMYGRGSRHKATRSFWPAGLFPKLPLI